MKRVWLTLILLAALPASAADWVRLRTPGEGDQYYYDRSKLFMNGDEITYWKKVTFKTAQPVKGQFAASGLYRERIHCAEHTLKLISYLLYAADGSTIEYVANHEGDAAPIIPDTLGDVFEKTACDLIQQKREEQRRKPLEEPRKIEIIPATPPTIPAPELKSAPTPAEQKPAVPNTPNLNEPAPASSN